MEPVALISLPEYETLVRRAVGFVTEGLNVAVVGPPGCGTTSVGLQIQAELDSAGITWASFDCTAEGDFGERLNKLQVDSSSESQSSGIDLAGRGTSPRKAFAAFLFKCGQLVEGKDIPSGKMRHLPKCSVIIVDHAHDLSADRFKAFVDKTKQLTANGRVRLIWLGCLDTHAVRRDYAYQLHSDTHAHLCLPELGRDDLLSLYREISTRGERFGGQWGEAMLYFVLDWCGNDLALVEELVPHFCGDWSQRVYDESVEECLGNWLRESSGVRGYRERYAALRDQCKKNLQLLCGGGKLVLHRPEIHLETSDEIRQLFLGGYLCTNLLPGYYQFRNLLVRFIVEEASGISLAPGDLLRRSANGRANALLQDVEVALRAMLKSAFRRMPFAEIQGLLKNTRTEEKLIEPELQRTLLEWSSKIPVVDPYDAKHELGVLFGKERKKYEASKNLWTKVCAVFVNSYGPSVTADPTPDQIVDCLTFAELAALLQSLSSRVFLEKARTGRIVDPPHKRWPDYLTKVRRLRNEAAHLRNISFQDVEDLLEILRAVRRDQLDFLLVP